MYRSKEFTEIGFESLHLKGIGEFRFQKTFIHKKKDSISPKI
jgi:hypothetical protein